MHDLLIKNATLINEGQKFTGSVYIIEGRIKTISREEISISAAAIIDASGLILIPGVIDDQVHFREPGLTHKGSIYSESRAAAAGGVTSFMEMPNTNPQTVTQKALSDKFSIAGNDSIVNYSFYIGATNDNIDELMKTDPKKVCGIKVFMGASTGNMLVDSPEALRNIFAKAHIPVAVHCEDEGIIQANAQKYRLKFGDDIPINYHPAIRSEEACYKSSSLAVDLAKKYGTRLHVLHLSTAKELSLFEAGINLKEKKITNEVCVHHLWFNDKDYNSKGPLIKWNPAIKSERDQEALFNAILNDTIDVIATDHAPHTLDEKGNTYFKAPSGGPLVQHSLNVMLEFHRQGKISLEKIVEKMCHAPADLFMVSERGYLREGYWADLVLIDPHTTWTVEKSNLLYKCGWSPFEGTEFSYRVHTTIVNGVIVYSNNAIVESRNALPLSFDR